MVLGEWTLPRVRFLVEADVILSRHESGRECQIVGIKSNESLIFLSLSKRCNFLLKHFGAPFRNELISTISIFSDDSSYFFLVCEFDLSTK